MMDKKDLFSGAQETQTQQWLLRAGPLALDFQDGDLRYIRLGDKEILRRIYFAVRDPDWGTVPSVIENLKVEQEQAAFRIRYDAVQQEGEIDLAWKVTITGEVDGTLTFLIEGVARTAFSANRIGFCVLHPIEPCRGKRCWVKKVDGPQELSEFPDIISPKPPFTDLRSISHEVVPGLKAEVLLEGDVFEMEDQRNYSDASYKIYSRPVSLPTPMDIEQGRRFQQKVTLRMQGPSPSWSAPSEVARISISTAEGNCVAMPAIGLRAAWDQGALEVEQMDRLRRLCLSHLRLDLRLSDPDHALVLERVVREAHSLDLPLEMALFLSDDAEAQLEALSNRLRHIVIKIRAWLVFREDRLVTPDALVGLAREHLQEVDCDASFGGGTNYTFAQVNMDPPPMMGWDFLCFPASPQIHLNDNDALVENLAGMGYCVETARQLAGNLPVKVTPISLKPHFLAPIQHGLEAEGTEDAPDIDPRQRSLLVAGWTMGSLKVLAEAGASSVTYFSTVGKRGVMEARRDQQPGGEAPPGYALTFPVYHVLADVGEFVGGEVLETHSSNPLHVQALALRVEDRLAVLVANLTSTRQPVELRNLPSPLQMRVMDESNVEVAMKDLERFRTSTTRTVEARGGSLELELLPYAFARLIGRR
jgi:hypothetical protein